MKSVPANAQKVKKHDNTVLQNSCFQSCQIGATWLGGGKEYLSKVLNIWEPLDSKISLKKFISGMFSEVHHDLYVIIFIVLNYRKDENILNVRQQMGYVQ